MNTLPLPKINNNSEFEEGNKENLEIKEIKENKEKIKYKEGEIHINEEENKNNINDMMEKIIEENID